MESILATLSLSVPILGLGVGLYSVFRSWSLVRIRNKHRLEALSSEKFRPDRKLEIINLIRRYQLLNYISTLMFNVAIVFLIIAINYAFFSLIEYLISDIDIENSLLINSINILQNVFLISNLVFSIIHLILSTFQQIRLDAELNASQDENTKPEE